MRTRCRKAKAIMPVILLGRSCTWFQEKAQQGGAGERAMGVQYAPALTPPVSTPEGEEGDNERRRSAAFGRPVDEERAGGDDPGTGVESGLDLDHAILD